MKFDTLYKRATNGKVSEWSIETNANAYHTTSGYVDGAKTTSEWTYVKGKNIGKINETTSFQQAVKDAASLWQKKVDSGYFVNINFVDEVAFFSPMLAKDWNDYKDKISYPIYSQPKLDGIRCIVREDGMWTRNGKPIDSAPHIFEALAPIFADQPDLIFDGELYADKFANDFNKICSLVKKTKPTKEDLQESANVIEYHIYDLPSHKGTFTERYAELMSIQLSSCCVIVETNLVDYEDDATLLYENYVSAGYEGQILRLDSKYENKRSKSLLKHKSFMDAEFTIKDVCEGEGNKMGMVGYMMFVNKDGISFKSNVKANWELSQDMWKNRKSLIGKEATIKFFNYTPDGIPRFPYVVKINRGEYE